MVRLAALDFDDSILQALTEDRLVIFAGAGVSMGPPSNLDSFWSLAENIAYGTGKEPSNPLDRFLGELSHQGVAVHDLALQHLSPVQSAPNALHFDLLRVFGAVQRIKVVTTNYDLHFEKAAESMFGSTPEVYAAPALPLGADFSGIVHVHGALPKKSNLIITDSDFGRAYLTEGWAKQFLLDVFNHYTVLFIGYSHDDVVMNYLARALPSGRSGRRFALTDASKHWDLLGITPIIFRKGEGADSYKELYDSISALAERATRTALVWRQRLRQICQGGAPSDEQTAGELEHALTEEYTTRFFTDAAEGPMWLEWLHARGYLNVLFQADQLTPKAILLAEWVAKQISLDSDKVIEILAWNHFKLNSLLWWALGQEVAAARERPLSPHVLRRLISVLIASAPANSSHDIPMLVAERCGAQGLFDLTAKLFLFMAKHQLTTVRRQGSVNGEDGVSRRVYFVHCEPLADQWSLEEVWSQYLRPNLGGIAAQLLSGAIRCLEDMHQDHLSWAASDGWGPLSNARLVIETADQEFRFGAMDIVIDAARDALEWLCRNQELSARVWIEHLLASDVPICRRLAVHAFAIEKTLGADERLEWLASRVGLKDLCVQRELLKALAVTYPEASSMARESLITRISHLNIEAIEEWSTEKATARARYELLSALLAAEPNCEYVLCALGRIRTEYPDWMQKHRGDIGDALHDLIHRDALSPWSAETLLSIDPIQELSRLLEFATSAPGHRLGHSWSNQLMSACSLEPAWGLRLVHALTSGKCFDSTLLPWALRGLSKAELTATQSEQLLSLGANAQTLGVHAETLAEIVQTLIRKGDSSISLSNVDKANDLAWKVWNSLDNDLTLPNDIDWPSQSRIMPGGAIIEYLTRSLKIVVNDQHVDDRHLPNLYKDWFESALAAPGQKGAYAQCVLAGEFAFLLNVDPLWTSKHISPLFSANEDQLFGPAWQGFLSVGELTHRVCAVLGDTFPAALSRCDEYFPKQRTAFVERFTGFVVMSAENPIARLLPEFFRHACCEDRADFASHMRHLLRHMPPEQKGQLWRRWLADYWQGRLHAIPAPLEKSELIQMLGWIPYLGEDFPAGVDYIVQSPVTHLGEITPVFVLKKNALPLEHPVATAKLVVFLCKVSSAQFRDLLADIAKRVSDLPVSLESELDEALARIGRSR